jgi:hypothetical protein
MDEGNIRPNIKPERSLVEKILQIVCPLILVAGVVLLITAWGGLPDSVPSHFNAKGIPDSGGSKKGLIYLPIIAVGIYLALTVYEHFPYVFNFPIKITEKNALFEYQAAREMIVCVKAEIIAVITYLLWASIETAKGALQGLGSLFLIIFIALLTVTLVYYILRMSRHKDDE